MRTQTSVIGACTMVNGIAHVFAQTAYPVLLVDINPDFLEKGLGSISKNMDRQINKNIILEADKSRFMKLISTSTELESLKSCDLVIEAATENFKIKRKIFSTLDKICDKDTILASNTSSISITKIGAKTSRPDKVIGMHFMNPVPIMKLVEIIRGHLTSDKTTNKVAKITSDLNKTPVECNDYPGFIANRILMPMINEAIFCKMEGVAEIEAIDKIMKLGMAHPMGPLALADLIGLDVCLAILEVLHKELGDSNYRSCPLLKKMVDANSLGRKRGQGFYKY